jgi:glycosyltransferase involved in cell wall biosynthesis
MIKILVDAHYFDGFYAGATTYLKGLYSELVKSDQLEIHLAARNIEKLKENFPDPRFRFVKLESNSNIKRLLFEFPKIIKQGKFDYAHFTYFVPFIKRCKYIVTIHDLVFIDFPEFFSLKYRIGRTIMFYFSSIMADELLTISNYSKNSIIKYFRIKSEKIFLTPCASFFQNAQNINEERIFKDDYLLYVSRIEPRKNHISLMKAFVDLSLFDTYFLIFIGKESIKVPEINNYLSTVSENVKRKIIFIENVSEAELFNYYQFASLFIFPSLAEGFGIPPLEALSMRTKVICSDKTSMQEFDFLEGYQFNPNNLESLKEKIVQTLQDKNYPFEKIITRAKEKYSWDQAALSLSYQLCKRNT